MRALIPIDGKIDIRTPAPRGARVPIWIESKARVEPKDVPALLAKTRRIVPDGESFLIGAPFLSPRTCFWRVRSIWWCSNARASVNDLSASRRARRPWIS